MKKTESFEFVATKDDGGVYACNDLPKIISSETQAQSDLHSKSASENFNHSFDISHLFSEIYQKDINGAQTSELHRAYEDMINLQRQLFSKLRL